MPAMRSLTITLPQDLADLVEARVAAGDYTSESEMVQDGLESLHRQDAAVMEWLNGPVAKSVDRYRSDPTIGKPLSVVSASLDRRAKGGNP